MKTNKNNSKNNIEQINIQNMQKKIREQAKRLCSMQEYINDLESTLKDNQSNNSFKNNQSFEDLSKKYNNLQQKYKNLYISSQINSTKPSFSSLMNEEINKDDLISKLKNENSELKIKLQKETNKNRIQQNQIEFLKQNLETNIVKSGLRGCLNYLEEKLINSDKDGEDSYFQILLEINKIREDNQKLLKEKRENEKKIENFEKNIENLQNNVDIINKLNNENNNLYSQNEILEKELKDLKNNINQNDKNISELRDQNFLILKENESLRNNNNKLIGLERENENLIRSLNELEVKVNKLSNENRSLSDYKLGYNLVLKENDELKNINQKLSFDNALFEQDVYFLKTNLDKLMDVGSNNILLKKEIDDLKNLLNNLKNRKQINNAFEKMSELEQRNKDLELLLNIKENNNLSNNNSNDNKEYINNIINNYNNSKENISNEKNNKFILANKYYADLLLRIIKYHIKDDINLKNILFQLLDLNHKKILLCTKIENLSNICNSKSGNANKNSSKENINNKKVELKKMEKELETLTSTISYFDKELIQFEHN